MFETKLGSALADGVAVGSSALRVRGKGGWRGKGSGRGEISGKTGLLQRGDLLPARAASWVGTSPCTVRVRPRGAQRGVVPAPRHPRDSKEERLSPDRSLTHVVS